MMRKPVHEREKVGGADSSSTRLFAESTSLEAMKTQPYASLEPRLQRAGRDLEAQLESLFERCPDLWGFSVQDKDNELFVSDVGITPRLSAEQYGDIYEDITKTLAALLDERPEVCELLRARTFARVLH
jgi:hypothetical protein